MTVDPGRVLPGGHRWMLCSSCGRPAIALEEGGRCRQTAAIGKATKRDDGTEAMRWSCPGKLTTGLVRPTAAAIARGEAIACEREGCGYGAQVTTARGERVCLRCLSALADALGAAGAIGA